MVLSDDYLKPLIRRVGWRDEHGALKSEICADPENKDFFEQCREECVQRGLLRHTSRMERWRGLSIAL